MVMSRAADKFQQYLNEPGFRPLFFCSDNVNVLKELPSDSIDFCMTSPPYWGQRQYSSGGIGLEKNYQEYIDNLLALCKEVRRILKPAGSFWLNLGDTYDAKTLVGIPWRVALAL